MKKIALSIAACAALLVATAIHAEPQDIYGTTIDAKTIALMQKGIDAVRARLKNPSSAQFRNVHFHRSSSGVPMTCGEVNSMDDGLYDHVGFQKFISAGRTDLTLLESQMKDQDKDFSAVWNRFCD